MPDLTRTQLIQILSAPRRAKREPINLRGVDLSGLDLSRLDFSNVNIDDANLRGCKLIKCYFAGTHAHDADFSGADLSQSDTLGDADEMYVHRAKFTKAIIRGAFLMGMMGEQTDFTDADLTGTNISHSTLLWAKFRRTKLIDVDFSHVRLYRNEWEGVVVKGGDWSGVYRETKGKRMGIKLPFKAPGHDPDFVPPRTDD